MIKIFNDLHNEVEEFKPLNKNKVGMYVCGVTVYDSPHLGHAYSAISFDIIRRYLEYRGYEVKYVMNYTDVDDKMIRRANERGTDIYAISQQYIDEYEQMQQKLFIKPPTVKPRATEEIPDIIKMIQTLEAKGFAYVSDGSVYFDTSKYEDYKYIFRKKNKAGEDDDEQFSQSDFVDAKRNIEDFVLWKKEKPGEPSWDSPWSKGRPGWHIECSVMATKYLGNTVDIHGGGKDLLRPHHQNEIAQAESATGEKFVNYWIHNGFLNVDDEKMSKSLGNFIPLMDMMEKFSGTFLRYYFATAYYKSPINFSMDKLEQAQKNLEKIQKFYSTMKNYSKQISEDTTPLGTEQMAQAQKFIDDFHEAMDNDFNAAKAIGFLFAMINYFQKQIFNQDQSLDKNVQVQIITFLEGIDSFFQFITNPVETVQEDTSEWKQRYEDLIVKFLDYRKEAKKNKNWALADKIRDIITETGVVVNDKGSDYTFELKK
ncbi:cysteine--tRNA ligase [Candidatus Lokiarchaeum ossiferum]|uniref:cysteine--tRNA ligase n=1 Tax=Candidatus Lokiarchaeum ossiferum TaxID=2951803 RepID=UPI00352F79F1